MSAEEPITPEDRTTALSSVKTWRELEDRTGGDVSEDEKAAPSQIESESEKEKGRKHVFSRHTRFVAAGVVAILAVALAGIAVAGLAGEDHTRRSTPRSGRVHAKRREAQRRRSGRVRWAREVGESPRPRQGRTALRLPCARHHARPRRKPRRPAHREAELPSQPPEPAPPEQPPEPSAPAPAAPSAPKERPGLRDGATESSEFGL